MPNGSKGKRGDYLFVNGQAVRVDGAPVESKRPAPSASLDKMEGALDVRPDVADTAFSLGAFDRLRAEEKRSMRVKCIVAGIVLLVVVVFSLCVSSSYFYRLYSPIDVFSCYGWRIRALVAGLSSTEAMAQLNAEAYALYPMYYDVCETVFDVFRYGMCGILLALSGMLYQNTFRNPIAAPSMLGVANGINIALIVLVLVFGSAAASAAGLYFLFSYVGGILVLLLVMAGGKWISGKGRFNVVNMLLVGTIVSQLCGVLISWAQTYFFTEDTWLVYYNLQSAIDIDVTWSLVSIVVSSLVSIIPIVALRFRLNLVSFDDAETQLLGVNPNRLRVLALACGSVMILTAQVNAGQVAMVSLVIPFVVRAAFGAEFRKQLVGNVLVGAIIMLVCADIISYFYLAEYGLTLGSIVSVVALPLFVWMISVRQRSWE